MKRNLLSFAISVGLVVLLGASPAFAGLKIRPVLRPGIEPIGVVGGGNLEEIFKVAAEMWEDVFKNVNGNWDVTIEFGWGAAGLASARVEDDISVGGNPARITRARVTFNNAQGFHRPDFFADPTPRDNEEYREFASILHDEVQLNVARTFTHGTGDAAESIDLLTLAAHEIGHALGLHELYSGFEQNCGPHPDPPPAPPPSGVIIEPGLTASCLLRITAPRPHAGLEVDVDFGPHLSTIAREVNPIMSPDIQPGTRKLISALDALTIAEIVSANRPILKGTLPPPF